MTSAWRAGGSHMNVATTTNNPTAASLNVNITASFSGCPPGDRISLSASLPVPAARSIGVPPSRCPRRTVHSTRRWRRSIGRSPCRPPPLPGARTPRIRWFTSLVRHEVGALRPGCERPYGPTPGCRAARSTSSPRAVAASAEERGHETSSAAVATRWARRLPVRPVTGGDAETGDPMCRPAAFFSCRAA